MDENEKLLLDQRFAEIEGRINAIHPSGFLAKSFWKRALTVFLYGLLASLVWSLIYPCLVSLLGPTFLFFLQGLSNG